MKRFAVIILACIAEAAFGQIGTSLEPNKADVSPDVTALVRGNNTFAWELFQQTSQNKGNIVISPFSVSTALAMTYAGARGTTAEEMAKVLRFDLPGDRFHAANRELLDELTGDREATHQLYVANALWGQRGYPFHSDFMRISKERYLATNRELDFAGNSKQSRETINRWVAEQTKDKIKELFVPADDDKLRTTRLVLTNAIYFKALWNSPFPKSQTKDAPFEVSAADKPKVSMMHSGRIPLQSHLGADFDFIEIPYHGDRMSMVVLLPRLQGGLAEAEKRLTAAELQKGLAQLAPISAYLVMPRFKITFRTSLKNDLQTMGMKIPFADGADFSAMSSFQPLKIGDVVHKAFFDVDETGTEAAAATGSGIVMASLGTTFTIDHPFLALIRDRRTGSILFIARVSDPRS